MLGLDGINTRVRRTVNGHPEDAIAVLGVETGAVSVPWGRDGWPDIDNIHLARADDPVSELLPGDVLLWQFVEVDVEVEVVVGPRLPTLGEPPRYPVLYVLAPGAGQEGAIQPTDLLMPPFLVVGDAKYFSETGFPFGSTGRRLTADEIFTGHRLWDPDKGGCYWFEGEPGPRPSPRIAPSIGAEGSVESFVIAALHKAGWAPDAEVASSRPSALPASTASQHRRDTATVLDPNHELAAVETGALLKNGYLLAALVDEVAAAAAPPVTTDPSADEVVVLCDEPDVLDAALDDMRALIRDRTRLATVLRRIADVV